MNWGRFFAAVMLLLSIAICIGFLLHKDYRKAVYWAGACIINSTFVW